MTQQHNYTPLTDIDEKIDIMEHVNQDHTEEVQVIAQFKFPDLTISSAKIADIFEEGILIDINMDSEPQQLFVGFELDGDLEEQILYLAYLAMSKQGKDFSGNKKQYFTVLEKQKLTPNFTRLTLESSEQLPENYAGYYYGMMLKTLAKKPKVNDNEPKSNKPSTLMKLGNQALLWGLKKMSSEQRQKVMKSMSKSTRIYTLRSAWQGAGADFLNTGYMDVFTHIGKDGKSAGTLWVESLNPGDIVMSRSQGPDKNDCLHEGKQVLIADETAFPALAGIIDLWKNPLAPTVILLSQNKAEQSYFNDDFFAEKFSDTIKIHRVVGDYTQQKVEMLSLLANMDDLDGAWAGLENTTAKTIRHYLRNEKNINGKANLVHAYWRLS